MTVLPVLDAAGRSRSPATMPDHHAGRPPHNKGRLYPADPPTVEKIVAEMRQTSDDQHRCRLRAPVVVLRRGGLRRYPGHAPDVGGCPFSDMRPIENPHRGRGPCRTPQQILETCSAP
jgi:hypothetical protein